jgi:hypothetical protein
MGLRAAKPKDCEGMPQPNLDLLSRIALACFVGTWIVGTFLFWISKNAAFKRRWYPRFVILVAILFILFWMPMFFRLLEPLRCAGF